MGRRALLIGSEIAGLTGVSRDLEIIEGLLGDHGFAQPRRLEKDAAVRDGIVAALAELAVDTGHDDAVVVYYSGHGGRSVDTAAPPGGIPRVLQFIAPYDFLDSTADDFRGITALEMSVAMAELSAKTHNVTLILDCCYSSRMARGGDLVARGIPRSSYVDIEAHLAKVGGAALGRRLGPDIESNPDVVRLVAAGPTQQAYECPGADGRQAGLLTDALHTLLTGADTPLTWADIARSARAWIQPIAPNQRPEAEGPATRLLFDVALRDLDGVLPVTAGPGGAAAGGVVLGGGDLMGVTIGDVYAARVPGHPENLAWLTVRSVTATSAAASVALAPGVADLPATVEASPVLRAGHRWPVAITGSDGGPGVAAVSAALSASTHVDPAGTGRALVTVDVGPAGAALTDAAGPLTAPVATDADGLRGLVRNVDRLARAAAVRMLDPGAPDIAAASAVTWGLVVDEAPVELPQSGATLFEGDRIFVRLRNTSPETLYFFVFSVGAAGRINRITNDPSGLALKGGEEWVVGFRPEAGLTAGLKVSWPEDIPRTGPRPATLTVMVTSQQQDLSALEQEGVVTRGGAESGLQALLAQVADGGYRDIGGGQDVSGDRYAVYQLEHLLMPTARPAAETATFLLDERPDPSLSLLAPRSLPTAPAAVAVRLAELVVLRNRALGAADLRLDALVVTGPNEPGGAPVHTARTWSFPRVRDGDWLSLSNLLLAHGPVRDYLDIAIWLSRDRSGALDLGTLIDNKLNDPAFVQAAGALALAAPPLAAAVASLGAVGTLVNLAYQALKTVVGDSVGVYRTSFLAGEDFGVGEHPSGSLRTAQDMSFRYRIEAV